MLFLLARSAAVMVFAPEALDLLTAAGTSVQGERVRIPDWMVRRALSTAPSRIPIGRRGSGDPSAPIRRAMLLERGRIYFGSGSDTQFTYDIQTGERRLATNQDVINAA